MRKEHYLIEIIAAWEPIAEDNGANTVSGRRTLSEKLGPAALPGGYPKHAGAGRSRADSSRLRRQRRPIETVDVKSEERVARPRS